jgi:hypothetical protein
MRSETISIEFTAISETSSTARNAVNLGHTDYVFSNLCLEAPKTPEDKLYSNPEVSIFQINDGIVFLLFVRTCELFSSNQATLLIIFLHWASRRSKNKKRYDVFFLYKTFRKKKLKIILHKDGSLRNITGVVVK